MTEPRDSADHTSPAELEARLTEFAQRAARLETLLQSTPMASLWLDPDLRVRLFVQSTQTVLPIDPPAIGSPVAEALGGVDGVSIAEDAAAAVAGKEPADREIENAGRWYLQRITPHAGSDQLAAGIAVTFTDITDRRAPTREIQPAGILTESIVDTLREALLIVSPDRRVRSANRVFCRRFRIPRDDAAGTRIYDLGNGQWNIPELRRLLEEVLSRDDGFEDAEIEHEFDAIGTRITRLNARRLDHGRMILLAIEDVTEQRRAERGLKASEQRLQALLDTGSQAVWETDADGLVVADSTSWRDYTGQTAAQWLGGGWTVAVHAEDRARAEREWCEAIGAGRERELLARELSHRVKNTFAVLQALAVQTGRDATAPEEMREAFLGRLRALSHAHSLLLDANLRSAPIEQLVRHALVACTTDHPDVVRFSGPDLALNAKQSLGLALVLHELGTNAGKYGALSRNDGRVSAVWQVEAARSMPARVQLEWRERHGPVVVAPRHQGFGTKLIEQASRYELDGEVEILYEPDGLVCRISFPLEGPT